MAHGMGAGAEGRLLAVFSATLYSTVSLKQQFSHFALEKAKINLPKKKKRDRNNFGVLFVCLLSPT